MKKRLFPLLLVLTLLLTLCTPFAQAEGRALSITSASGRAGETVSPLHAAIPRFCGDAGNWQRPHAEKHPPV